jgi:hypothetical protein
MDVLGIQNGPIAGGYSIGGSQPMRALTIGRTPSRVAKSPCTVQIEGTAKNVVT